MLNIDTANWMSKLKSELSLTDLSIPGTHDSGTYGDLIGTDLFEAYAKCQNHHFKQQLEDGIRFFDIRIGMFMGNLHIIHGSFPAEYIYKVTLTDVFETFRKFLSSHRGETILISVKADDGSKETEKKFAEVIKVYENLFLKTSSVPKLGDARGKIVLFKRLHFSAFGIPWLDWEDNQVFPISKEQGGGTAFDIEDGYKKDYHDTHVKLKSIKEHLNQAMIAQNKKIFFVTFCSIGSEAIHTPQMYAQGGTGIDPAINQSVFDYINAFFESKRFGLVIFDFYKTAHGNNYLTESLIKSNPGSDSIYPFPTPVNHVENIIQGKKYYIISKSSHKCIQLSTTKKENGSITDLCNLLYEEKQQFVWNTKQKENKYYITSSKTGKSLEAEDAKHLDQVVQMSTDLAKNNQLWEIEKKSTDDGWFKLKNCGTQKYMDVCGDEKSDGTTIITYANKNVNNQLFKLYMVK